jgi:hypothetical protein
MMATVSVMAPERPVYQGWTPCMDWCRTNCRGMWSYDTEGVFIFDLDSDATAFLLVWGR